MKTTFLTKLKNLNLAKKIALIALIAVVIIGMVIGTVLIVNKLNAPDEQKEVTLTFYDENRSNSEQITVPLGSTVNADAIPKFSKVGHSLAAWSYVNNPTKYLKATDEMQEDTEFIAVFMKNEELFESSQYLYDVPGNCEFSVNSTVELTSENLNRYIEFNTVSGLKNSIRVEENGDGVYKIMPEYTYLPGETYSIRITDADLMHFVSANGVDVSKDNIRKYSFSVKDVPIGNIVYREDLVSIPLSSVAGIETANEFAGENLSVVYFNENVPLRIGEIIRITHENELDDDFYKIKAVSTVDDSSSEYNGKPSAVVSVPKAIEYLKEYEVKAVGLTEEDIVSEDILTDEELMNVVYTEIMTNNEYARAIDTMLYTAKQTPAVQNLVSTLSLDEKQEFENSSFRKLGSEKPTMKDLNLSIDFKNSIKGGGWVGYELGLSVSPEFQLGSKAKLSVSLSVKLTVKLSQISTSFYVDDDTGLKKTGWTKVFNSWEYCTCTVRTSFDTDVSFNITLTMTDGEDNGDDNGFDPNEDISEQVSNLLDVILEEDNDTSDNAVARKLLNEYLERLDYDLINDDLDYVTLFELPLGRLTACIYGVDVTVRFDFVVSAGLRCGMTSSFKYHVDKEEITSNGKSFYKDYDLEKISIYQIAREELGSNYTAEEMDEARTRITNSIRYEQVKKHKTSNVLSENVSFDFTIGGKAGLRAGIKISVRFSGFFLDDLVYIGASVELGAYTELTAYAAYHYEYDILNGFSSQSLTGAVKLEIGFYVKFDVEWKFFWYESSYTIIEEQWPLFTVSTTPSLYDFDKQSGTATVVGRQIDLKGLASQSDYKGLFDLCKVDVFENSVKTESIVSSEIDQMRFNLINWSVNDPRDNSDVSSRYYVSVSNSSVISVEDKESWRGMRDTDVATIKVYVGLSGKNFLTGDPIGKTLTLTVPLGEIIDLENTYTIRFLDHLGNVMTYKDGNEMTYKLYGNEFPENYPNQSDIYAYLDTTYALGRMILDGESIWRDSDGNAVKLQKATENKDYYINLKTSADLVRYTYYDPTDAEMKHIDQYLLFGEVAKEPDINTLGEACKLISKWDVSPELVTIVDGIQNYNVKGIDFEESYRHYPVNKDYYLEVFADYGDKYSEVIWKVGDHEFTRTKINFGARLDKEPTIRNTALSYFTITDPRHDTEGGVFTVPNNEYTYRFYDGKLYSMKIKDLDLIINNSVIKELQDKGAWKDEYVIEFPATEVKYDDNVTVEVIAKPKQLYPELNQYLILYSTTVKLGSTLTKEILPLSNIKRGSMTLQVTVSDLNLPYVIDDLNDSHVYVDIVDGMAKISLCYYADEIKDLTDGRRTYVILDANGGRFGELPNGGVFAYDTDFIVPSNELFNTIEYLSTPSVPYNDIVGHSEYAIPVKFGSKFIGWSTTKDGKNIIGDGSDLNPGVGDATEIRLYAVYENDTLVKLNLTGFGKFKLNGTEYQLKYTVIYLAYKDGNPPKLPILELEEGRAYLDGWMYADGTPFETLPLNPTADKNIEIKPGIKYYPKVYYSLSTNELSFAEQLGFYYESGNTAYVFVKDINDIRIPNVPIYELRNFKGWQIYEGATLLSDILSNEELIDEVKALIASGEMTVYTKAVYQPHSSSFTISDDCDGEFDVALQDEYVVAVGKTFAESGIPVPSKQDHTFDYWRVGSDDYHYHLSDTIPQGMDHYILSAVFKSDYADVVFDANGGTFGGRNTNTVKIKIDTPISEVPVPTRDGFGFIGWCTLPNGTVIIDTDRFTAGVGLVLYAIWEDRSPITITFDAGDGKFSDGSKTKSKEIQYPYNFSYDEVPTYTGAAEENWVFGCWGDDNGLPMYDSDTVNDGDVFTAIYRRTDVHAMFQPYAFQYNEISGITDNELDDVLFDGADEYGQVEIFADAKGLIPYPTYSYGFTIPEGYEIAFMIPNSILSDIGISTLKNAGSYVYLDVHELQYRTLTVPLTTDMVNIEDDYPIVIKVCTVPTDGPDERVRFDEYLYYDVGYGIISSEYDTMINYPNGRSVPLDENGNIVIPEHTISQQLGEGQMKLVLIEAEYLTDVGIEALRAKNARVYTYGDGFHTYYEVNISLTRDMVKIELQPKFIIAYIPQDSIGVHAAMFIQFCQLNTSYHLISYSGGKDASFRYLIPYNESGELVLPSYTISDGFTVEEGMKLAFLVDSRALTDDAVAMFQQSGAGEYIVDNGVFYELNIMLTQDMVKIGMAPDICLGYIPAD